VHLYQRAIDHGVIFYDLADRLVYYTITAVKSKKYGIVVNAASIMFTHIHQSVMIHNLVQLGMYLHDVGVTFSRLYNNRYFREGALFQHPAGRSTKNSTKAIKTNIIYVFNNHVEKRLCDKAIEERWSFLAYAKSQHPFSKEIPHRCSKELRKAIRLVDRRILKLKNLEYADLDRILPVLTEDEKEQFIDYVIHRYALIDFNCAASFFQNIDSMINAVDSTTGSEYEIQEDFDSNSDIPYNVLTTYFTKNKIIQSIYNLSESEKELWSTLAHQKTNAPTWQIKKFIHY